MALVKTPDLDRIRSLSPDTRLYLIAGPDEATMGAQASRLIAMAGKDAERVDMLSSKMADDVAALAVEAASMSLFNSARVIRLEIGGNGDDCIDAVSRLLDAETVMHPVIATAPAMTKTAKLLKLAASAPAVVAVQCYQPDRRALTAIAVAAAAESGLRLANSEAALLIDLVSGDQSLMRREIEKIALYLDAAPDRQRQVQASDLAALGAASHEEDVGECINIALGGKTAALPALFAKMAAVGVAEIRIIRALAIRVMLLARLRSEVDAGAHPRTVVANKRHGVFWKEQDAVTAQLHIWDSVRIARLMSRLLICEQALKSSGTAGAVLFRKLLTDISWQAARAR